MTSKILSVALASVLCSSLCDAPGAQEVRGWLSWRGPQQDGTTLETGLPDKVSTDGDSWTFKLAGRGTPAIANGRVYALGYEGDRADLEEVLVCLDASTGKKLWEHRFSDFLTDTVYYRFAIGAPTIDPQNGNVFCMSTAGLLTCFAAGGKLLWQHSMGCEYGRLTFPNGRTGAVLLDSGLAIVHVISASWGPQGPARDRFYAYEKDTGVPVWSSTPGGPPKDSSFSFPVVAWENGKRVFYAGLGGGNVVCVNLLTGDPLWRFQLSMNGLNANPLLYKDIVIATNGRENIDDSTIGRMVALRRGAEPEPGGEQLVLGKKDERWRNHLVSFTSSPVLVGNRIYITVETGELCCVDADTGVVRWHEKLAADQIHASPVWGDGKLYVPMNNGSFYIVRPAEDGPQILQKLELAGNCLGAPAIADGRIYVHTTDRLYSFAGGTGKAPPQPPLPPAPAVGKAVRLQVIPGDIVTAPGEALQYRVRSLDANGLVVAESVQQVSWSDVPAKGVTMSAANLLTLAADAAPVATVIKAQAGQLRGTARLRIVRGLPYVDDFEDVPLKPSATEAEAMVGPARPYWVGAGPKWEVRELDGNKVLARTLDNPLFQRTQSMIGGPQMANYTMQVDIYSDGNRRSMSSGGVVNQRYLIVLKGNHQELEVSSNQELLKESVPFKWQPKVWYRLKTRVDIAADGSATIRGKVWPRDEPEPDAWTIEVRHSHGQTRGSPGLYGFTPQSRFRVYLDNVTVTPND